MIISRGPHGPTPYHHRLSNHRPADLDLSARQTGTSFVQAARAVNPHPVTRQPNPLARLLKLFLVAAVLLMAASAMQSVETTAETRLSVERVAAAVTEAHDEWQAVSESTGP